LPDEDLNVGPLLARLLGVGVVMLDDAQRCTYADARARDLLGAADAAEVRDGWEHFRDRLRLPDLSTLRGEASLQHRVDVGGSHGRRLRIEVHPLAMAGYVVLLRDVSRLDGRDRLLILASEAQANRPAVSGLVHQAKGPLNNFHLTLALLASGLARGVAAPSDAVATRWRRYLDVLQTEAARLTACINEIDERSQPGDGARCDVDVNALIADVARLLRHAATLRNATIKQDPFPSSPRVTGDAQTLRLALVGLTLFVLERTAAKGSLLLEAQCEDDRVRIRITGTPGAAPDGLANALFQLTPVREVDVAQAVAARTVVESHGGEVSLIALPPHTWGFAVVLPVAAAPR